MSNNLSLVNQCPLSSLRNFLIFFLHATGHVYAGRRPPLPPRQSAGFRADRHNRILCRNLCRNPPILAHIPPVRSVSLRITFEAGNLDRTRMNTGSRCYSRFFGVAPSSTGERFDTVEVRSSSLLVPTITLLLPDFWDVARFGSGRFNYCPG